MEQTVAATSLSGAQRFACFFLSFISSFFSPLNWLFVNGVVVLSYFTLALSES